jgi:hypothetical protein
MTNWPLRAWIGFVLVGTFWFLNWYLDGLRTHWGFFPLWLGYCLAVDGFTYSRTATSLWARGRRRYLGLFLASAPAWWLFELINWRTANWEYQGRSEFTDLEYFLLASLSFSTVVPAVFGTWELVSSFRWVKRIRFSRPFTVTSRLRVVLAATGVLSLALVLAWPVYFFPLVWISLFLMMDPLNDALGHRSLIGELSSGNRRTVIALATGCLICGLFWEMWNYYSYPKWTYNVPFVGFGKVFEMPLLGYGGYIPFSMELFALYHFVTGWISGAGTVPYLKLQ